jgi:hypothetical protein
VLRVHTTGEPGSTVSLGASVESGAMRLHRGPFTAESLGLCDDDGRIVVVPAGQPLVARVFEGMVRRALDHGTPDAGPRLSVEIAVGQRFWILDAPSWQDCLDTGDPQRRLLPPRADAAAGSVLQRRIQTAASRS